MTTIYISKKRKEFSEAVKEGKYKIRDLIKDFFNCVIREYSDVIKDYDTIDYEIKKDGTLVFTVYKYDLLNSVNIEEFQIIPITFEIKAKYSSLKNYKEIIISGKKMNWDVSMNYAKKNKAVLPNKEEGEDIAKYYIEERGSQRNYFLFWTRKEYAYNLKNAISINSYGSSGQTGKRSSLYCFCLR